MAQNNLENGNLKIGEIAARSGVSVDALRYYERLGLLPKAPRTSAGYRLYDQRTIDRLGFIRRAQSFGFTLDEIRMMIQLERASSKTCSSVLQVLRHKLDDLDRRHKEILRLKRELSLFKNACEHALACGESCPVIEDFVKLRPAAGDEHSAELRFPIGTENSDRVKELLQSTCGLRLLTEKLSGLSPREDRVRRFILESYPRLGRAPKLSEIKANLLQYSSEQIEQICQKLHALDIVYIREGSKELAGAYPFIDFRKDHLVRFVSGKAPGSVHAMCAIDALGIPFMYGRDVDIESYCGQCKKKIKLDLRKKKIISCDPPATVVFAGLSCTDHAAVSLCTTVLFFCCESHLGLWRRKHAQLPGTVLSLGEALALGKSLFENRLK